MLLNICVPGVCWTQHVRAAGRARSFCPVLRTEGGETVSLAEALEQQQGGVSGGRAPKKVIF